MTTTTNSIVSASDNYYNQLISKRANQLLSKFQLTRSSVITDDVAYFKIIVAEDIIVLIPNGEFCLGEITISLSELEQVCNKYDACDKEYFLVELCGSLYNRI